MTSTFAARIFPIAPPGTGLRQPIHADDVARAIARRRGRRRVRPGAPPSWSA